MTLVELIHAHWDDVAAFAGVVLLVWYLRGRT